MSVKSSTKQQAKQKVHEKKHFFTLGKTIYILANMVRILKLNQHLNMYLQHLALCHEGSILINFLFFCLSLHKLYQNKCFMSKIKSDEYKKDIFILMLFAQYTYDLCSFFIYTVFFSFPHIQFECNIIHIISSAKK